LDTSSCQSLLKAIAKCKETTAIAISIDVRAIKKKQRDDTINEGKETRRNNVTRCNRVRVGLKKNKWFKPV
jgi:hypothetical protein